MHCLIFHHFKLNTIVFFWQLVSQNKHSITFRFFFLRGMGSCQLLWHFIGSLLMNVKNKHPIHNNKSVVTALIRKITEWVWEIIRHLWEQKPLMLRPLQTQQKYPLSIPRPETLPFNKAITEGNEQPQVLIWNTKDDTAERIWVFERLDTEWLTFIFQPVPVRHH